MNLKAARSPLHHRPRSKASPVARCQRATLAASISNALGRGQARISTGSEQHQFCVEDALEGERVARY